MTTICDLEGHLWAGGGQCRFCGERLRCVCGRFVREEGLEAHIAVAHVEAITDDRIVTAARALVAEWLEAHGTDLDWARPTQRALIAAVNSSSPTTQPPSSESGMEE